MEMLVYSIKIFFNVLKDPNRRTLISYFIEKSLLILIEEQFMLFIISLQARF